MADHNIETINGVEVVRWNPVRPDGQGTVDNFGDLLGPEIVRRLADGLAPGTTDRRLVAVGSILQLAVDGDVVWGSGINAKLRPRRIDAARQLDVRAVRGPLTALALEAEGNSVPPVHGDPALLIPVLFPHTVEWAAPDRKRRAYVEVPNVNDYGERHRESPTALSPLGDPWGVIEEILSAELVVGSSLHAIVVAEAFGVPARLIRSGSEHAAKYVDYYAGTGRRAVDVASSVEEAVQLGGAPGPVWDADALREAFPADLWGAPAPMATAPPRRLGDVMREIAERAITADERDREAWAELARRTVLPVLKDRSDAISADDLDQAVQAARELDAAGVLEGSDPRLDRTRTLARLGLHDRLLRSATLNEPGHRAVLDTVERAGDDGLLTLGGSVQLPDEFFSDVTLRLEITDDELEERVPVAAHWVDSDPSVGTVRWKAVVDVNSAEAGSRILVVRIESEQSEPRDCIVQSPGPLSFPRWWVGPRSYRVDRTRRGNVVLHVEDAEVMG